MAFVLCTLLHVAKSAGALICAILPSKTRARRRGGKRQKRRKRESRETPACTTLLPGMLSYAAVLLVLIPLLPW